VERGAGRGVEDGGSGGMTWGNSVLERDGSGGEDRRVGGEKVMAECKWRSRGWWSWGEELVEGRGRGGR